LYGISNIPLRTRSTKKDRNHIITSSIEHEAILQPCKNLEEIGCKITYLPVDESGMVDLPDVANSLTEDTIIVSIMFANNEVGTIQPIKEISELCKKYDVLFHTDAVQAVGKVPINVKELGIDALSVSSHKINGPKGGGALFIKKGIKPNPMILGGGQENGLRSGTENVASVVGFGKACEIAKDKLSDNISHFHSLYLSMLTKTIKEITHVKLNGHPEKRIFNNIHLTFMGVNGEDLIIKLDEHGIAASTGSACSMHTQKASHVLGAMGFNHEQITGSLRMSFGYLNTLDEVDQTIDILKKVVTELRSVSPYKTKYNF